MTLLEFLGVVALTQAQATAWLLARERPYYRPLALLLSADLLSVVVGIVVRWGHLSTQPRPYQGLARILFHVEQAAGLVWPIGVAAVALVVLARRPAWPAFVSGVALLLIRVALYPWLRQERLAWLLLGEQMVLVSLLAWCTWQLPKHTRTVERMPAPVLLEHHKAALFIVAIEASLLAGPYLLRKVNGFRANPFEFWWLAQIGYSALFVGLAITQVRWTWAARRLMR